VFQIWDATRFAFSLQKCNLSIGGYNNFTDIEFGKTRIIIMPARLTTVPAPTALLCNYMNLLGKQRDGSGVVELSVWPQTSTDQVLFTDHHCFGPSFYPPDFK
jgi:hypothetical protein